MLSKLVVVDKLFHKHFSFFFSVRTPSSAQAIRAASQCGVCLGGRVKSQRKKAGVSAVGKGRDFQKKKEAAVTT